MIHGNYRPLIESDMWPIELCYRQWRWSIILEVVLAIFWCENKCSLLFRSPIVSPGDSVKDDIADDLVWLLVISGTINGFIVCIWKYSMHELPNWNGRTSHVSDYFCCRIRPEEQLHDAQRDLLAIAKFLVLHSFSWYTATSLACWQKNLIEGKLLLPTVHMGRC